MNKFGGASAKLKLALLCIRLAQIFGEPNLHRRDDYSMEIELPLADCPQNLDIFANALNSTEKMTKELNELGILE